MEMSQYFLGIENNQQPSVLFSIYAWSLVDSKYESEKE